MSDYRNRNGGFPGRTDDDDDDDEGCAFDTLNVENE